MSLGPKRVKMGCLPGVLNFGQGGSQCGFCSASRSALCISDFGKNGRPVANRMLARLEIFKTVRLTMTMNHDNMRVEELSEFVALRQRHVTVCGMPTSVARGPTQKSEGN